MKDYKTAFECDGCGYEVNLDDRIRVALYDCPNCDLELMKQRDTSGGE